MLFRVPLEFSVNGKRIGSERRQTADAWTLIDIEIPDHDDDTVPVVLTWNQEFDGVSLKDDIRGAIGPSPGDGEMHVRKFGENFYQPIMRMKGNNAEHVSALGENAEFLTGQSVLSMLERWEDKGVFGGAMPGATNRRRLTKNGGAWASEYETVDWSELSRREHKMREDMSDCMLVDGVFYARCPEPKIVVFWADQATYAVVTTTPHVFKYYAPGTKIFEIEDIRQAMALIKRRNSGGDIDGKAKAANERHLPTIDPYTSIYASDVAWMRKIGRIAIETLQMIGDTRVANMPEAMFAGYRDLYRSVFMGETEERFDIMAEALENMLPELDSHPFTSLKEGIQTALEILENRPVRAPNLTSVGPKM